MPRFSPVFRLVVAALLGAAAMLAGCVPRGDGGASAGDAASRDSAAATPASSAPADTLLTLDRSTCFGPCPSYALTVFEDGRVVYAGRDYVEVEDTVRSQIGEAEVKRLVERFQAADYFSYARGYDRDSPACALRATDHPTVRTSFRWEGQRQRVVHYHGCYAGRTEGGAFERAPRLARLAALEDTVDAIVGTARWTGR